MIKLCFDVSDVMHTSEHTKYASCDLPVNFWIFLWMPFRFMMKKDCFKQKLLHWPQIPFKISKSLVMMVAPW